MKKSFEDMLAEQIQQGAREPGKATQPAPASDPAQAMTAIAAREDAARLSLLMADARQAITEYKAPDTVAALLTQAIFGESSPEAETVAALIRDSRTPSNYEMSMAARKEEQRQLRKLAKQLEQQAGEINAALAQSEAEARQAESDHVQNTARETAIIAIMALQGRDPGPDLVTDASALYEAYKAIPAAMGLLYGLMTEAAQRGYDVEDYNLITDARYHSLRDSILEAASGKQA